MMKLLIFAFLPPNFSFSFFTATVGVIFEDALEMGGGRE